MTKSRYTKDAPMEVWRSPDGWEWRVLRKYSKDDINPFTRWFCFVTSPHCPQGEVGDVYVGDIKFATPNHAAATRVEEK